MKRFIGVKEITAKPMTRGEHSVSKGFHNVINGKEKDEGYQVIYKDGYESWSPKDVFEEAYRETTGMTFGLAIESLKKGNRVARKGWNGKGMFLYLVNGCELEKTLLRGEAKENLKDILMPKVRICSHIDMKATDNSIVVGWLASQTDMLADDWGVV
jgi:hypothetical protein